ncbi:Alpha carbonic anhydrase 7 [Abeliophyllum distichum]|uniref:Carbonic anhydrase n=1 Tax=Abeliophyllum distichum TaxID=126358 RepID=A0ABD1R014_9LAMI
MNERLCLEERLGLSAVIMGSRGFGATKKGNNQRLGSVSDYCVRHCVCPVVVVRYPEEKDSAGRDEPVVSVGSAAENGDDATHDRKGQCFSRVSWNGDAGSIFINGTEYHLQEVHWHTPSEHTINGIRYDMELHMVHKSSDLNVQNRTAVIGVLYKIGRLDEFLSKLNESISSLIDKKGEERDLGIIDPNDIQAESQSYYRYMGSLTTPPCDEGVIWSVNTKVKNVSRNQINLLKEAVLDYAKENARPLQPRNNRDIDLYLSRYPTGY